MKRGKSLINCGDLLLAGFEGELALKDASDSAKKQEAYIKADEQVLRGLFCCSDI